MLDVNQKKLRARFSETERRCGLDVATFKQSPPLTRVEDVFDISAKGSFATPDGRGNLREIDERVRL
jgi:hypothetical protein